MCVLAFALSAVRHGGGAEPPAPTAAHLLGDSFASIAMQAAVNARVSSYVATVDGVGGSHLDEQKLRFDATPEYYDNAIVILDGALELDTAPAIAAIDGIGAHVAGGRYLYVKPG